MNWALLGFLALNFVFALTSDTLAKVWSVTNEARWFFTCLALGIFTIISFMLVVRAGGLSVGSNVALILTVLGNTLIGVWFFREALVPMQWLGLALGLVAVVLILRPA